MNAFEIIRNIIPEGIAQCKKSINERLQIPDFTEPEPQDSITSFKTSEEWLDLQIRILASSDYSYVGEYFGLQPLMSLEDFNKCYKTYHFNKCFSNYSSYLTRWHLYHNNLVIAETSRKEIHNLIAGELLEKDQYDKVILKQQTISCITKLKFPTSGSVDKSGN